ncbi:MAG: acyltransferase [Patescibacteria group bacterium]
MKYISNIKKFLKMYYHVRKDRELSWVILEDFVRTILLIGGSGLPASIFRGLWYRLLIKYDYPTMIGRRFKIIGSSNFRAKQNLWIKDDVSILASGKIEVGHDCVFCERVSIWSHEKGVSIGDNVAIGMGSYICATGGRIEIGDEVRIADSVRFYSFNHKYDRKEKPISGQGYTREGIKVKYNTWIGSGAVILDGVTIGENSVIAAGAVVTKNVPSRCLVAGIPAKIIKRL